MSIRPNLVLVHGAWADGSCWSAVIRRLQADAPNLAGLVYVAAFAADQGESLDALASQGPVPPAVAHQVIDKQGLGWLPEDDYVNHFAADFDPVAAAVMHPAQQPLASSTFAEILATRRGGASPPARPPSSAPGPGGPHRTTPLTATLTAAPAEAKMLGGEQRPLTTLALTQLSEHHRLRLRRGAALGRPRSACSGSWPARWPRSSACWRRSCPSPTPAAGAQVIMRT